MGYRDVARVSEEVLAVCDREPIHIPESVQPHGALIAVDVSTWQINRVSENLGEFLRKPTAKLLGSCFLELFAEPDEREGAALAVEWLRCRPRNDRVVLAFPAPLNRYVCECHVLDDRWLIVELERHEPQENPVSDWDELQLLRQCSQALDDGADMTVTLGQMGKMIRGLIGYDRVMFYKMDDEGHGEVIAEDKRDGLDPFLGLHFPASDIPFQARRLYIKNRVRQLCNVNYAPVGLIQANPDSRSTPLDMSLCHLRSISPVHVEYLQNMGVSATLVISIVIENRLWGLIACHNHEPRHLDATIRQECEKLAHHVTNNIRAIEHRQARRMFEKFRQLPSKLLDLVGSGPDWQSKFLASGFYLLSQMNASGMAIFEEGRYQTSGLVPEREALEEIRQVLNTKAVNGSYGCNSLRMESESLSFVGADHAGCLWVEVCESPKVQMLWFRREQRQTANWAGNPTEKSQSYDGQEVRLSPRKSFEKWTQIVEGYCVPWETLDLARAELIGQFVATRKMEQFSQQRSSLLHQLSQEIRKPMSEAFDLITYHPQNATGDLTSDSPDPLTRTTTPSIVIGDGGGQVVDVLEGILDLCCFEFGSVQPQSHEFQVAWLVERLKPRLKSLASKQGVSVEWAIPKPVPRVMFSDSDRIEFLIRSLVQVALTQQNRAIIRIELGFLDGPKPGLSFRIHHTGSDSYWRDLGKLLRSEQHPEPAIDPWPWVDLATSVRLDVARQYAQLLGGSLTLERAHSDQDATVVIQLPIGPVDQTEWVDLNHHAARDDIGTPTIDFALRKVR